MTLFLRALRDPPGRRDLRVLRAGLVLLVPLPRLLALLARPGRLGRRVARGRSVGRGLRALRVRLVLRDLSVLRLLRALQALPGRLALRVQLLLFLALRAQQGLQGPLERLLLSRVLRVRLVPLEKRALLGQLVQQAQRVLRVKPGLRVPRVQRGLRVTLVLRGRLDPRGRRVLLGLTERKALLARRVRPGRLDLPGLLVLPRRLLVRLVQLAQLERLGLERTRFLSACSWGECESCCLRHKQEPR